MSSYSSPLPPYVTPGWNDPPTDLNSERKKPSFGAHRHRRPVDPSIQGSAATETPPPVQQPCQSFQCTKGNEPPNSAQFSTDYFNSQIPMSNKPPRPVYDNSTSNPQHLINPQHRAVYDAFTIPSARYQESFDFARINPTRDNNGQSSVTHPAIPFQQNFTNENHAESLPNAPNLPTTNFTAPMSGPPIESIPSALIYIPPNVSDLLVSFWIEAIGEMKQRSTTSPDPANYIAPLKAAGDVSLNGSQLVQFITKATLRLPLGVTRDGIQLRIAHFNDLVLANAISEGLIKKLNFVVDALDRGMYDDALQFFEQMQAVFTEETKTSWAQGLRLLICELKRPARSGSAGLMHNH
ncbi:unnamed protein product [Anisakis simplex]|uniref:Pentatricopeptide repeat-containing protein n=1 Tax=Anisakis simplex TaxID=6269 RepID=A0A0M3K3I3_ANISI|nr:unnamed protein product [Anisakis simplex]